MISKKRRQGVSLIEALFVLGILAILLGMVMMLYSKATSEAKSNALKEEILDIYKIGEQITASKTDFDNIQASDIINSGLLNRKYISNGLIVTPYGTEVDITTYSGESPTFGVYVNNIPKDACALLSTQDFSGIANAVNTNWNWAGGVTTSGVSPDVAWNVCKTSGNWIGINFMK